VNRLVTSETNFDAESLLRRSFKKRAALHDARNLHISFRTLAYADNFIAEFTHDERRFFVDSKVRCEESARANIYFCDGAQQKTAAARPGSRRARYSKITPLWIMDCVED